MHLPICIRSGVEPIVPEVAIKAEIDGESIVGGLLGVSMPRPWSHFLREKGRCAGGINVSGALGSGLRSTSPPGMTGITATLYTSTSTDNPRRSNRYPLELAPLEIMAKAKEAAEANPSAERVRALANRWLDYFGDHKTPNGDKDMLR